MRALAIAATMAGSAAAAVRWLRVAQREHYLAGSATRFASRWWTLGPNRLLAAAVLFGVAIVPWAPIGAAVVCLGLVLGPFGLSLRGRTSKLAWTRRLRTLAALWVTLQATIVITGIWAGAGPVVAALSAALVPLTLDLAMVVAAPLERRLVEPYVKQATRRLQQVRPTVVAITGSYGKTSTKGYVAHLLKGSKTVVASPASFNNRAGLARAVNEHLSPGTEVFVAEMGTYGRGEIAELCSWCRPDIGVITAIGPVHLERMGTEENVALAKAEILEGTPIAVLNADHPLLERLADQREKAGQRLLRCSGASPDADVAVVDGRVLSSGRPFADMDLDAPPGNVACAVAVALELGVEESLVAERLGTLPTAAHRLGVATGSTGAIVIDDTYNSNPAGAALALTTLGHHAAQGGKEVLVTPGMVELGDEQHRANVAFAARAATSCSHIVVVGHTNRRALLEGADQGAAEVIVVDDRQQAVEWVRAHLGEGDAVLYENDLPDHFP